MKNGYEQTYWKLVAVNMYAVAIQLVLCNCLSSLPIDAYASVAISTKCSGTKALLSTCNYYCLVHSREEQTHSHWNKLGKVDGDQVKFVLVYKGIHT